MYDIIIVGAGPAGLTAALYARRANKKVLVLEQKVYGGQIINTPRIENYPALPNVSGFDFATALYNQVENLDTEIKYEEVIKIEDNAVITNKERYNTKKIIIATGTKNRKLNIEGEEHFLGKGISFCAACDGAFYKNKKVAVVGGGNTALEDALYLSGIASEVYLIHRRDEFRGEARYQNELKEKSNINLILNSNIIKVEGKDFLESIIINKNGKEEILKVDGLFIAIGRIPENTSFKDIIELDENGYIKTEDGVHTNKKDIYVAGDVRVKELRQLTTAVADGSLAASLAIKEMED